MQDGPTATRTLDLASTLEVGHGGAHGSTSEADLNGYNFRDNVAAMARQYVRNVVGFVQRVSMAIAPSRLGSHVGPKPLPGSPEALALARWIFRSYRYDFE